MARPEVCLSLGMGVDSVALALLWFHEPATRPCPMDRILFVSCMTGDEWPITGAMMTDHLLPVFRDHHARYAQIARAGMSDRDGIAVLDDSREPGQMYLRGPVSLSQEMLRAGTVPQVGGHRKCSLKWKGWPIDQFLAREMADSYVQVMGYEAGERKRADKDRKNGNSDRRTGRYPLIEMGWDRFACQEYIRAQLGVTWPKSACVYCPFALTNEAGRERVLDRYAENPHAGLPALMMEHIARTLNPRQGLAGSERGTSGLAGARTLIGLLEADPRQQGLLRMHSERLHEAPWKLFEVRRAYRAPGQAPRQLRALATGSRPEMTAALRAEAAGTTMELSAHDGIERAWRLRRSPGYPAAEWLLAAAPAGPADKTGRGFTAAWEHALATGARALW